MRHNLFAASLGILITTAAALAAGDTGVRVLDQPPTVGGNPHYIGNRVPLLPSPLIRMPVGSVRPEGWLRHQLELMADGMSGRLTEISPWCKYEGNAWTSPDGKGEHGWEELPYWLKGFIDLGYVLGDERIIAESRKWVDAVLAAQRPNGYFGDEGARQAGDLWPHMVMLYALRTFYDATGDARVLPFMSKYFKWQASLPLEKLFPGSWQKIRAGDNLDSVYWLYNRTGEKWLLDFAQVNHDCTANWKQEFPTWHGVNICQCFREPAQFYQQSGEVRYLNATQRNYDTVIGLYGQVPGGLFGADENARRGYIGPRQGTETCSIVEMMFSQEMLLGITGKAIWADRCEEIAFNMLPAASTPDYKAIHYLTCPNQIQIDRRNKAPMIENAGDMFSYTPYEQYRCCQHNVAFGWPYFSEHLWMVTQGGGLAAAMYAPCAVKAKVADGAEVKIEESTDYPFRDTITFKLSTAKPVKFPLLLRIPGWCSAATVKINGEAASTKLTAGAWAAIDREWADGDTVVLSVPMELRTRIWKTNGNTVSIDRGPLTYSLKIGEKWQAYDNGKPWKAFEVFPTTPWNYGLVVDADKQAASVEIATQTAVAPQPFTPEATPITLKAKGKRIPQWIQEANGLIGEIKASPVSSDRPEEEITLIPMGCTRLRVSVFPQIAAGAPSSANWDAKPKSGDLEVSASYVNGSDTLAALNDNVLPSKSGDTTIPRFTWWDRRGTGEWVQYTFSEPRKVSSCEVYWFDDRAIGGGCRAPMGWRLIYKDGRNWRPVKAKGEYGAARDKLNRVTFEPITTTQLRLVADLHPDFSAGILEWRVGE